MTPWEFWKERYDVVVADKKQLGEKLRETLEKNAYLEAQLKYMTARYENTMLSKRIYKERLDKSIADRKELQSNLDIWVRNNGEKQAEIEELKRKIESLVKELEDAKKQLSYFTGSRDGWRDRAKKAEKEVEEIKQVIKESYSDGYSDGNEEGQNELWEMLQMVKDMQPNEFDTECECLGDVIDMDLEDFKEAYDKWEAEQKKVAEEAKKQHVEYMRDYLKRYCIGRWCINCPLHDASRPVTSCLFSKMTEEEIEKRYNKVIERKTKDACDAFYDGFKAGLASDVKEVPVSCDIPIKDLASWKCTIEATVEVNKDLLEKVCGVKPDEEDHELVYGDAVRIPWCDYDYMYIGPEPEATGTQARLFDPKNHAVVVTFATNVTYNGGKVILTREGEDDLRKICKDKK